MMDLRIVVDDRADTEDVLESVLSLAEVDAVTQLRGGAPDMDAALIDDDIRDIPSASTAINLLRGTQ